MKKAFFIAALAALVGTGAVCAQGLQAIEEQVDTALYDLGALTPGQIQVLIEPVTLEGTKTTSRLSALLFNDIKNYAVNKSGNKFKVVEKARAIPQGVIAATYGEYGGAIKVTVTLSQNIPESKTLGSAAFDIPTADLKSANIAWLPENIPTVQAAAAQNNRMEAATQQVAAAAMDAPAVSTPAAPVPVTAVAAPPAAAPPAFTLEAWADHEDGTYLEGEAMFVKLYADKDCYFKVYAVDAGNSFTLLYPNKRNKNNRLKANEVRTIPEKPVSFTMSAPYGRETILVFASDKPFDISDTEMAPITVGADPGAALARGVKLTETPADRKAPIGNGRAVVQTSFAYTVNPPVFIEETVRYEKPEDMKETVNLLKGEAKKEGGAFKGDETAGTLSTEGMTLSYKIVGDEIEITLKYAPEKNYTRMAEPASLSRGAAANSGYRFTMAKPADWSAAVEKARSEIVKIKGAFTGDEAGGEFRAPVLGATLSGVYNAGGDVEVTIKEKPGVPVGLIESKIKKTFGGK